MATTESQLKQPTPQIQSNPNMTSSPPRYVNPRIGYNDEFQAPAGILTGILQLVCGIVSILFGVLSVMAKTWFYTFGAGIWSGMFYVVAGVLGLFSKSKRSSTIVCYLIMSLISSNIAFWFAFGIHLGAFLNEHYGCGYPMTHDNYYKKDIVYTDTHECWSEGSRTTIDGILMVATITEFLVSIIGSVFSCAGICYPGRESSHPVSAQKQQPMIYPAQQPPATPSFGYSELEEDSPDQVNPEV